MAIQLNVLLMDDLTATTMSGSGGVGVGVLCDFTYGYETDDFTLAIINLTYTDPVTGVQHTEYEEYGKYSIGRIGSVSGRMVHVSSNQRQTHDACDPIDTDTIPSEPWIALAQYGNCRDSVKLKHIANTNASAAVIYNNRHGTRLIKMHHKESSTKSYYEYQEVSVSGLEIWHFASSLISVFIPKEKGEFLASMVDNGTRVMVQISITTHPMRYTNINRTSVLFVSISFIVLMIISLAWLIFYYVQRFRYIHAKDILARRLNSAAKKAMDKIPTKTIRPADLEKIFEEEFAELCPVCIDTFKTCDIIRILPCKHLFHKSCVDPWLLENRSCPMCKMDILKYYGLVFTGSQESILNIEVDVDVNPQHHWHQHQNTSGGGGGGRGGGGGGDGNDADDDDDDDIEVVHIPIVSSSSSASPMTRNNRHHSHQHRSRSTSGQRSSPRRNGQQQQQHNTGDDKTAAEVGQSLQSHSSLSSTTTTPSAAVIQQSDDSRSPTSPSLSSSSQSSTATAVANEPLKLPVSGGSGGIEILVDTGHPTPAADHHNSSSSTKRTVDVESDDNDDDDDDDDHCCRRPLSLSTTTWMSSKSLTGAQVPSVSSQPTTPTTTTTTTLESVQHPHQHNEDVCVVVVDDGTGGSDGHKFDDNSSSDGSSSRCSYDNLCITTTTGAIGNSSNGPQKY
ncbi:E3 ubiquitin-protein ligase Godzilla-like [Oppia nitens]|uniref:E3 ubiquitin-protein ligase Godzilla-like n=1 Tax=Oppia nitens TaxID=1686743 RepID=UPI0023DA0AEA|nr:E3 ubiquitin-protein ligase Godzilla-like [Oppia nitens]